MVLLVESGRVAKAAAAAALGMKVVGGVVAAFVGQGARDILYLLSCQGLGREVDLAWFISGRDLILK